MEKSEYKRRQYFIKKDFQIRFMVKFILILLLGIALSTALLLWFSHDTLTSVYSDSGLEITSTAAAIMPSIIFSNLITLAIICLFTVVVLLFISHKIAGPLFRFEKDLQRVADGDLTVMIQLRKKDQLTDIAFSLNRMIQSMFSKVAYIDTELERIQKMAEHDQPLEKRIQDFRHQIQTSFNLNRPSSV